jgi:hypothetical protein
VRDTAVLAGIGPEFVVAAPNVLHERVTAQDHAGGVVTFESAHRTQPRFEPAVVGFDGTVALAEHGAARAAARRGIGDLSGVE